MKKTLLLCGLLSAGIGVKANTLLKSPVSGALGHSTIAAMAMASDGKDVVLLLADKSSLYALDINDNDPTEIAANAITSIPDFVNSKLKPLAGGVSLSVVDIEVNPISKSVYVLATASGTTYVFKVRNNGATITMIDLTNIAHSTISWGGTFSVNDMTWGDNTLFASSGSFSLDGSVAKITAPFAHGGSVSTRTTSMFKSNWGGMYVTKAPLETMTFGKVKSVSRLMGVTTCAPGFSLQTSSLSGSGTLEVKEDFNVNMGISEKVVYQQHDGKGWLFDLHDENLYRIGESFLDGSPISAGKFNNSAVMLRNSSGAPASGLTTEQYKQYAGSYKQIAFWDEYRLLVLEKAGTLKMMQTAATAPGLSITGVKAASETLHIYPNPASTSIRVETPQTNENIQLHVYTMEGRLVKTINAVDQNEAINIQDLAKGQYLLKAQYASGKSIQQPFVIQ